MGGFAYISGITTGDWHWLLYQQLRRTSLFMHMGPVFSRILEAELEPHFAWRQARIVYPRSKLREYVVLVVCVYLPSVVRRRA